MPGATARTVTPGMPTDLVTSVKDVWVVGGRDLARRPTVRPAPAPQVDLFASLPRRTAESLFWLGRAVERAEVAARAAREVRGQLDRDPDLAAEPSEWAAGVLALLRAAQAAPSPLADGRRPLRWTGSPPRSSSPAGWSPASSPAWCTRRCSSASSCRPPPAGCSAGSPPVRGPLTAATAHLDDLDAVLVDLAAFAGLATESTVRGPAWRFLDIGRRLERGLAVLGAVEAALGVGADAFALQPLAEVVLAANESLVTYRRRYRSDVVLDAVVDLLIADDTNPRSLAFQLDRLREHRHAELGRRPGDGHTSSHGALGGIDATVANGRRPRSTRSCWPPAPRCSTSERRSCAAGSPTRSTRR